MTGFLFDTVASVELQDEVRFAEMLRGQTGISFVPPHNMAPGERLRLTVRLGNGESQQSVTFMLVAHRGQATRQVEVFHDGRTRESYQQEADQERAKSQELREENQQLRNQLARSGRLRGLFLDGALGDKGVQARQLPLASPDQHSDSALHMQMGTSYRSKRSVAVDVSLKNSGIDPWRAVGVSMVTATGEKLEGIVLEQPEAIPPQGSGPVFVETAAGPEELQGVLTLNLWDAGGRTISIPQVTFP